MSAIRRVALSAIAAGVIGGCSNLSENAPSMGQIEQEQMLTRYDTLQGLEQEIPKDKISNLPRRVAAEGIKRLGEGDLDSASLFFNRALKLSPSDANIQLLNGLTYHIQGVRDDSSKLDLAEEGYKLAIQFDPSNWIAHYQLGLLYMDRKQFASAQERFAESLLYRSDSPELLYNMVCASYYNHDPATAAATLGQLERLEPDSPRTLRAGAMVAAALGREGDAIQYYNRYSDLEQDRESIAALYRRLRDWDGYHQANQSARADSASPGRLIQVANNKEAKKKDDDKDDVAARADTKASDDSATGEASDMVIVDVVIVRSEEKTRTRKGVNLLNGLSVQFGARNSSDKDTLQPGWQRTYSVDDDAVGTTITRAINLPALTYSLNIANSTNERNEVLARPTLVAQDGLKSRFFSGINIRAAAVGDGDSKSSLSIQDDIGVTLEVTPKVVDDERVQIFVTASRTFLRTPSDDVDFQYRIETSKTDVEANVQMRFGETLILSGLSEKETENIRDGVPGLQDIPIVQYLFAEKSTLDFQKSVLILLTPRKPAYVYQDTASLPPERRSQVLSELQARFSDWFKPYPNWASVFHHLQSNVLYREFRTGDVTLERWESQGHLRNRLNSILDFIYF